LGKGAGADHEAVRQRWKKPDIIFEKDSKLCNVMTTKKIYGLVGLFVGDLAYSRRKFLC